MRALVLCAGLCLMAGCGGMQVSVGQYANLVDDDEYVGDGYPTVVNIEGQISDRWHWHCFHQSHIAVGWPWGFGKETEMNACGFRYLIWRRRD